MVREDRFDPLIVKIFVEYAHSMQVDKARLHAHHASNTRRHVSAGRNFLEWEGRGGHRGGKNG